MKGVSQYAVTASWLAGQKRCCLVDWGDPGPDASTQPILKTSLETLGLIARKNSRHDGWAVEAGTCIKVKVRSGDVRAARSRESCRGSYFFLKMGSPNYAGSRPHKTQIHLCLFWVCLALQKGWPVSLLTSLPRFSHLVQFHLLVILPVEICRWPYLFPLPSEATIILPWLCIISL